MSHKSSFELRTLVHWVLSHPLGDRRALCPNSLPAHAGLSSCQRTWLWKPVEGAGEMVSLLGIGSPRGSSLGNLPPLELLLSERTGVEHSS